MLPPTHVEELQERVTELESQLTAARTEREHYETCHIAGHTCLRVAIEGRGDARRELSDALTSRDQYAALVRALVAGMRDLAAKVREARKRERSLITQMIDADYDEADPADFAALAGAHDQADSAVTDAEHALCEAALQLFHVTEEP